MKTASRKPARYSTKITALSATKLAEAIATAREATAALHAAQPDARTGWVYVFRTVGRNNARYGIRFSFEPETCLEDGADTIELRAVAGFRAGLCVMTTTPLATVGE